MRKACGLALVLLSASALAALAQDAAPSAKLDRYVGSWGGYAGRGITLSPDITADSAWMNVVVKKTAPDTIALQGSIWGAKATLRYDKSSSKYLLGWEADQFPPVADLPLQFSEQDGFSGSMTISYKGNPAEVKATIKNKGEESDWGIEITQGRNRWSMSLTLGKGE